MGGRDLYWLLAVIVVGSAALLYGTWNGRSVEREGWQRLVVRASNASPACASALDEAADDLVREF
ncbi:hypothetical protein [Bauldia litoralis]|uniref:hypothetical protein n=1 Tax=Bauldia litoralis TaxID=665467 RepID=UPI0032634BDF